MFNSGDQMISGQKKYKLEITAEVADKFPDKASKTVENVEGDPKASPIDRDIASAISLQQQGKNNEAIEKWQSIANTLKGMTGTAADKGLEANAWFSIGYLYEKEKGNFEQVVNAYTKVIQLNPDDAEAHYKRGNAKYKLRQYESAIADYDQAIRLKPDYAEAYNNRGLIKSKLGRHKSAIADHDQAILLNPDDIKAYNNRGLAKHGLGQYEAAIADFDQAIQLRPDYAEAYNNRGNAKSKLGRREAAIADYDQTIQLRPDYIGAYFNRGDENWHLGNEDKARQDLEKARSLAQQAGKEDLVAHTEQALKNIAAGKSPFS